MSPWMIHEAFGPPAANHNLAKTKTAEGLKRRHEGITLYNASAIAGMYQPVVLSATKYLVGYPEIEDEDGEMLAIAMHGNTKMVTCVYRRIASVANKSLYLNPSLKVKFELILTVLNNMNETVLGSR